MEKIPLLIKNTGACFRNKKTHPIYLFLKAPVPAYKREKLKLKMCQCSIGV